MEALVEMEAKVNTIINDNFTQILGYEFYLETKLMKKFKSKCMDDVHIKVKENVSFNKERTRYSYKK